MKHNYLLSFTDDATVFPMLKQTLKETLKLLSLAFSGFKQLLSCLLLNFQVISLSWNLPN